MTAVMHHYVVTGGGDFISFRHLRERYMHAGVDSSYFKFSWRSVELVYPVDVCTQRENCQSSVSPNYDDPESLRCCELRKHVQIHKSQENRAPRLEKRAAKSESTNKRRNTTKRRNERCGRNTASTLGDANQTRPRCCETDNKAPKLSKCFKMTFPLQLLRYEKSLLSPLIDHISLIISVDDVKHQKG